MQHQSGYYIPQNLSLKYNNNFLTFSFIGISQRHNKKMRYQYKLEGLDKTWSALTLSTDASYGNLSPGTYIFKIKARNGEGFWSKEFALSVHNSPSLVEDGMVSVNYGCIYFDELVCSLSLAYHFFENTTTIP